MEVEKDFVCEHGMPQPWATCIDCMDLPPEDRPRLKVVKPAAPPPKSRSTKPRAKRAASGPAVGRLPRSGLDDLPTLVGDKDLVYEIPPTDLAYYVTGPESAWLPISSMPRELRERGYVYLQCEADLVCRARVTGIGFRDQRWDHAAADVAFDLGPGATIELDGNWASVEIDLGDEADTEATGYRYVVELPDGTVALATPTF